MSKPRIVPASFERRMGEIIAEGNRNGSLLTPTQAVAHEGLANAFEGVKRANKNFAAEALEEAKILQKEFEDQKKSEPRLARLIELGEAMVLLSGDVPLLSPQPGTSFIKSTSDQLETFVMFQNEFILLYTELSKLKQNQI